MNATKEAKIVKVINDIKVPVGSLMSLANCFDQNHFKTKETLLCTIEEMIDKLDNFWFDFKSWNLINVDLSERKRIYKTDEFLIWIKNTHSIICKKYNNIIKINTEHNLPD